MTTDFTWSPGARPAGVFWDFDGAMIDSSPGIFACARYALAAVGVDEPALETLATFVGPPIRDSFAMMGVPLSEVEAAVAAYREAYAAGEMFNVTLQPGVLDVLGALAEHDVPQAITTSKPTIFTTAIVTHLGLETFFERNSRVFGADLDAGGKATKADVIAHAIGALGIADPHRWVLIGDTGHDVTGAAEHGIACIGVTWGFGAAGDLAAAAAMVNDPDDLLATLNVE